MKTRDKAQFGDFQTPLALARDVLRVVQRHGVQASTVIEPSCGQGAFLVAAAEAYPQATLLGVEINAAYLADAATAIRRHPRQELIHDSFFDVDWQAAVTAAEGPILILGNPPWVTNAELGSLGSRNLPAKTNSQKLSGFDALTGKSNFDISEWMLLQNLRWLQSRSGTIAVLCKTSVARKVARFAWKNQIELSDVSIYAIDAARHFGAAVDACLFFVTVGGGNAAQDCSIYRTLDEDRPSSTIGFIDGFLVADVEAYRQERHLRASGGQKWRSGIKHDCARVMELSRRGSQLVNGFGEQVEIEDTYLFPLAKSSDVGGKTPRKGEKLVIVPQRRIGDDTSCIAIDAPRTWDYLVSHEILMTNRISKIYRGKPRFSIFGVGDYSFSRFKIAISGLYKGLDFKIFGPRAGKPTMFDDTVYFLSFDNESDAQEALELLVSEPAQRFLRSMIFWDDKRPVTADLLRRLDMGKVASELGFKTPDHLKPEPLPLFALV